MTSPTDVTATGRTFHVGPHDVPDMYQMLRQVGRGGEAQLWKARIAVGGGLETVAVKILHAERYADFAQLSVQWAEQAELLRFVRHPGVVGVREHFEGAPMHWAGETRSGIARSLYLVMNWVEGHALPEWILRNPGHGGLLRGMQHLEQLAEALDALHSGRMTPSNRPIVHGDLSPKNVMINESGQAELVDFGLARLAEHQTRNPAGTPGYAAPEVWSAGVYSPASDRYSFGAVAYFAMTGMNPGAGLGAVRAGLAGNELVADLPPGRIDGDLQPDPVRRPAAVTWMQALRSAATTSARTTVTGRPPAPLNRLRPVVPAPPTSRSRLPPPGRRTRWPIRRSRCACKWRPAARATPPSTWTCRRRRRTGHATRTSTSREVAPAGEPTSGLTRPPLSRPCWSPLQ